MRESITVDKEVEINVEPPTISIDALDGDGIVNIQEKDWTSYNR